MLNRPRILLLDEPTTGLDPNSRRELWALLMALKKEGLTLILTTHYMEEAEVLCDRIVMINQGRIIADGSLEAILSQYGGTEMIVERRKATLEDVFIALSGRRLTE